MPVLDVSQWRMDPAIAAAVAQGFNLKRNLHRLLCKEFPWFGDWKIAFFVKEDLPSRIALGWKPLRVDDLPDGEDFRQRFNQAIEAHRFSLRKEADSSLWFKDLSICVMPKVVWEEREAAMNALRTKRTQELDAQFADREAPLARTDAKTWKIQNTPTMEAEATPRKPGRPKQTQEGKE